MRVTTPADAHTEGPFFQRGLTAEKSLDPRLDPVRNRPPDFPTPWRADAP